MPWTKDTSAIPLTRSHTWTQQVQGASFSQSLSQEYCEVLTDIFFEFCDKPENLRMLSVCLNRTNPRYVVFSPFYSTRSECCALILLRHSAKRVQIRNAVISFPFPSLVGSHRVGIPEYRRAGTGVWSFRHWKSFFLWCLWCPRSVQIYASSCFPLLFNFLSNIIHTIPQTFSKKTCSCNL